MNIQDFLTYLLDAIACGFISLIVLDLGDGLSILNTFVPRHTTQQKDIPLNLRFNYPCFVTLGRGKVKIRVSQEYQNGEVRL